MGDKPGEMTLTAARDQAHEYRLALKKDGIDPRHSNSVHHKATRRWRNIGRKNRRTGCETGVRTVMR